ncbi:nucleotidyltransferase domain-containing protein [Anaerobacillus sp. CMMVII]|uniref:nucleotidyltransferase domain-containing protein n=1 Tax=Anaerobacillus sp. CMMVII TaxID=2755588 RepID=UPI0021B7BB84|nr:nucleotidyltransferase domain-containing protein [Anaerobacillus sp. CMMVII]MCT8138320.1 nucleotidyltransferase domain-containing protein [Anaerobacillus sp. CMMVII]
MAELKRLNPIEAAEKFIVKYFPQCDGAILAGSVVKGDWTPTSDLDIIIFDKKQPTAYRESLVEFGWAIEVFVHNFRSYQSFFITDCERARPSLPRMVLEGISLRNNAIVKKAKAEAKALLEKGPEKWSHQTLKTKQYFITDALEDFIGVSNRAEEVMIANTLVELASEFVLRTNGRWIGASKWLIRELNHYDERFAKRFFEAFDDFYRTGTKEKVIELVDEVLEPYGGRFFAGYSLGKSQK